MQTVSEPGIENRNVHLEKDLNAKTTWSEGVVYCLQQNCVGALDIVGTSSVVAVYPSVSCPLLIVNGTVTVCLAQCTFLIVPDTLHCSV